MNYNQELKNCLDLIGDLSMGLSLEQIQSTSRKSEHVKVRHYIAKALRAQGVTLENIGHILGHRTHATIINLLKYEEKKQCRLTSSYIEDTKIVLKTLNQKSINSKILYHQQEIDRLKSRL